jgi:uncharacterized protein
MRVVLDTNIVTSALLWRGTPYQLLLAIRQAPSIQLYTSAVLLEELAEVLSQPSLAGRLAVIGRSAEDVLLDYISVVQIVEAQPLAQPVCRDPDDDAVLALGLAAQAELIVSGDKDLLVLGQHEGIPIVTARAAIGALDARFKQP